MLPKTVFMNGLGKKSGILSIQSVALTSTMSHCDSWWFLLASMAVQAAFLYYFPPHEYMMPLTPLVSWFPFCLATHYRRDDPVSGFTEILDLPPNTEHSFWLVQDLLGRHCPLNSPDACLPTHFQRDDPVSGFTDVLELPQDWENSNF